MRTLLKGNRLLAYDGTAAIPVWKSTSECVYYGHTYTKNKSYDGIGSNRIGGRILALDRKYMSQFEVDTYYRFKHWGAPFYYKPRKIETNS